MKKLKTYKKSIFTSALILFISYCFSQNSSNNSTPFSIDFVNGISSPVNDFKNFSESGFNSGFIINKNFCNNISIGLKTNYTSLTLKNTFDNSNERWNSFSISIGPKYNIDINKVFVQFYGRLGLSFINIPEITHFYPQTNIIASSFKDSNSNGLNTHFGINLGTEICYGLHFFVSSEYATNLNSKINYQSRDLSSAIDATGQVDPDLANEITFRNNDFSFSSLNINFGIRLDLSSSGNRSSSATDYNSSRSNRRGIKNDGNDGDNNNNGTRATDYNSSRSNRRGIKNDGNDGDNNNNGTRATDYNSSRSNRRGIKNDGNDGDNNNNGTRATDYNSSRSNRRGIKNDGNDGDNNNNGTRATDYNSSRSNRRGIKNDGNDGDNNNNGTRATDYNSSRSNRRGIKNDGNDGDNNNNGTRATDYNSSRSNRADTVKGDNGNGGSKITTREIISQKEEKTILNGKLLGVLLASRKFEFKKENGDRITGIINSKISDKEIIKFSHKYLNKICKIQLLIIKINYFTGKEELRYEILEILKK